MNSKQKFGKQASEVKYTTEATLKNKETTEETKTSKSLTYFQQQLNNDSPYLVQQQIIDDFTNVVGSFSSKSINTYDESNQSVA